MLAGYGSDIDCGAAFAFRNLARTADAFFVKLSWLFRLH